MAGLDNSGFTPDTFANIKTRIEGKLEALSPGFDFSPESPDGQFISIMTYQRYYPNTSHSIQIITSW